jgi:hypothetical protein
MLHIIKYRLFSNRLLDPPLRLDVERIGVQSRDLALLRHLGLVLPFPGLSKELGEASWVGLGGFG